MGHERGRCKRERDPVDEGRDRLSLPSPLAPLDPPNAPTAVPASLPPFPEARSAEELSLAVGRALARLPPCFLRGMVRALAHSLYTQTQHNPPHDTQPRGPAKGDQANANVSETYFST